jgi:hydroxylysine kinase
MTPEPASVSDRTRNLPGPSDRPPPLTEADAAQLADKLFALAVVRVRPLAGERDRNFQVTDDTGSQFVLKVSKEDPCVFDFQTQALLHVARADPALQVPRVVQPVKAAPKTLRRILRDPDCRVRCVTYLRGRPLAEADVSPAIWRRLGGAAARLDKALAGFRHPADDRLLIWDLKRADRVRGLLKTVKDHDMRSKIGIVLQRFSIEIKPRLPSLRAQVIHNDLNPHNVLGMGRRRLGIVDFGDCIRAPLVQELATTGSYQISPVGHPLESFGQFLAAYHSILPLQPQEIAILPELILVRLALWITITSWRALHEPDNARYILRNERVVRTNLARLLQLSEAERTSWLQSRFATLAAK